MSLNLINPTSTSTYPQSSTNISLSSERGRRTGKESAEKGRRKNEEGKIIWIKDFFAGENLREKFKEGWGWFGIEMLRIKR